jgi:endonuclease YncB( thermonuclease family)
LSLQFRFLKTPRQQWSGVFLWFRFVLLWLGLSLFFCSQLLADGCSHRGGIEWLTLANVTDGDSIKLADGRAVRLIAVNTPELGRAKNKSDQPLARQGKQAVQQFFAGSKRIAVQWGEQKQDHYGRWLGHVFRENGDSLAASLLRQGLAWQVLVPPNDRYWRCLRQQEKLAESASLGVWSQSYKLKDASKLQPTDSGFQRLQGVVSSVTKSSRGWWLDVGNVAISLSDRDARRFIGLQPEKLLGQTLRLRGWLIDRSRSAPVTKKGYPPLLIKLQHPQMLERPDFSSS